METFTLHKINVSENGKKISYEYGLSAGLKAYFNEGNPFYTQYDVDVSATPSSLLVIPLLANIMPMAWFLGFDVQVESIDKTFFNSLEILKEEFSAAHPQKSLKGSLKADKLIENHIDGKEVSLLFSGGLDSFESLTRHYHEKPYLFSIHGADVEIKDQVRWQEFMKFNAEEEILDKERLFYIESNLREFYTYKVDLLADLGWWGTVQHGMALLGVLAPYTYIFGITNLNIASSGHEGVVYTWGSNPKIDENMRWANTSVSHDGYQFSRTDKGRNVVEFVNSHKIPIKLRVCFSELRSGYNCNRCHKCQRTILSLILEGANPNEYGFEVPDDFYKLVFSNFNAKSVMTKGIKYQWECLQDLAKGKIGSFFVLKNKEEERNALLEFASLDLDAIINKNEEKVKQQKKRNFLLKQKFPKLYELYRKIRY